MQLKKFQWISRPEKVRVLNSKQLKVEADGLHEVLYTYSEDGKFTICAKKDESVSFSLFVLLSPENEITLKVLDSQRISYRIKVLDIETEAIINARSDNSFSVQKQGSALLFSSGEATIASFSFPSIEASVSVGARLEGKGSVILTFNMET